MGQKLSCGQGLEGPWERPPPLDEPQRDGNSEDQVGDRAALSGEHYVGSVGWGGRWEPQRPSQALSPLYLSFRAWRGALAPYPALSPAHKLRVPHLREEALLRNPLCPHLTLYPSFHLLGLRLPTSEDSGWSMFALAEAQSPRCLSLPVILLFTRWEGGGETAHTGKPREPETK